MFATKKLTKERGEQISTWYFRGGFLLLPWLWLANVFMFWRYKHHSEIIASNVKWSGILAAVVFPMIIIWYVVLFTSFKDSKLWVIRPGVAGLQEGFWSSGIYENI